MQKKPLLNVIKNKSQEIFVAIIVFVVFLNVFAIHSEIKYFQNMIVHAKESSQINGEGNISTASAIAKVIETPTISPGITQSPEKSQRKTLVSMFTKDKNVNQEAANIEDEIEEAAETLRPASVQAKAESEERKCNISDTFTPEVKKWEKDICRWSEEHNMDPDLIATIMQIESCGNDVAKSATGVRGLFQVTGANLDGENPWDPNVSMAKGPGKVLKVELEASGGDVRAAMAGYNGGGRARDYIAGKVSRNQFYWFLVNHPSGYWWTRGKALAKINEVERYAQWGNIYFEAKENKSDTLNEWLDLGGDRLCSAARRGLAQYVPEE